MKLITAIIQPHKLELVHMALTEAGITGITVNRVSGHGRQGGGEEILYRGAKVIPSLLPKVRLDMAVNDDLVDLACDTIMKSARSEGKNIGNGKIFITNMEECIRIGTGEKGCEAI